VQGPCEPMSQKRDMGHPWVLWLEEAGAVGVGGDLIVDGES